MRVNDGVNGVSGVELFEKLLSEKRKLISEKTILDKKDAHQYPIIDPPFEIPENWYWCYLSDISIIQEGPGIRKHQYSKEGVQFLTVTNILEGAVDIDNVKKYISRSEYDRTYKHFTLNKGDIVTACSGGSWGKSAIFDKDDRLILNTSTLRLRFFSDFGFNKYLYFLTKLQYFKDSLSKYTTGQQPNYGYYHYSRIPVPLPPLLEQKRIVEILDEVFATIDKAKANIEKNLLNVKELFESYLENVFANNTEGWVHKKLNDVFEIKPPKVEAKSKLRENESVTFLPMEDLNVLNYEIKPIKERKLKEVINGYTYFANDDVLLAKITPCFENGKIGIAKNLINGIGFGSSEYIVFRKKDEVIPEYLYFFLSRNSFRDEGSKRMTGAVGHKRVPKEFIEEYVIPFPKSKKEQLVVVNKLNQLDVEIKKLLEHYQHKLDNLEELQKSVLQRAFNGQLTTATKNLVA